MRKTILLLTALLQNFSCIILLLIISLYSCQKNEVTPKSSGNLQGKWLIKGYQDGIYEYEKVSSFDINDCGFEFKEDGVFTNLYVRKTVGPYHPIYNISEGSWEKKSENLYEVKAMENEQEFVIKIEIISLNENQLKVKVNYPYSIEGVWIYKSIENEVWSFERATNFTEDQSGIEFKSNGLFKNKPVISIEPYPLPAYYFDFEGSWEKLSEANYLIKPTTFDCTDLDFHIEVISLDENKLNVKFIIEENSIYINADGRCQ